MKQKYEPVIGLEIHVELNTKSKMFCRCSADYFGEKPNTHTCPVCLGLPGSLPFINEEAINSCIKIGLALNCKVNKVSSFERKNYFYPDLPKGYQISQYRWPLSIGGRLQVTGDSGQKVMIRINRVHQEEDTGKLTHANGETLIDFNRSSVPLVEIVTEPDFRTAEEVRDYTKKIQQLVRYLGVSNADMERGDMRLEANVSVRKTNASLRGAIATRQSDTEDRHADARDDKTLPNYRIELKNINSFRFMVAAIEYEIKRQIEALEKGEKLTQETRGWDENKKETYLQRSKEEAHDYRYFPDPDLPELKVETSMVERLTSNLPEMPWDKEERFIKDYGISENNAKILSETKELAEYFEEVVELGKKQGIEPKQIANLITNQKIYINKVSAKEIIEKIQVRGIGVVGDVGELEKLAEDAIKENPASVEAYKNGKLGALNVLFGAIMKKTSGKADINKVRGILEEKLK